MPPYSFIFSLRAKHPREDLSFLNKTLNKIPQVSWTSGDWRVTPARRCLGGNRIGSYWAAKIIDEVSSEQVSLEDCLENICEEISTATKTQESFFKSGGSLGLYISMFGSEGLGIHLRPDLLERM